MRALMGNKEATLLVIHYVNDTPLLCVLGARWTQSQTLGSPAPIHEYKGLVCTQTTL